MTLCNVVTLITGISMSAVATNGQIKVSAGRGGGGRGVLTSGVDPKKLYLDPDPEIYQNVRTFLHGYIMHFKQK